MAEWETAAAAELSRLEGRHATKMRATVIALVDARLAGTIEEDVWRRADTCSRTVYHTKWKKDPTFAAVLGSVERMAREWKDGEAVRALGLAAKRLALASPVAVARAISMLHDADSNVVLRAAFGILDRAGVETAAKSSSEISGPAGDAIQVNFVDYRQGLDGSTEAKE
jgi:hypothetical protein